MRMQTSTLALAIAGALLSAPSQAQSTPESRQRCATRLSAALLGTTPTAALLTAVDPQLSVDAMIDTPQFREKLARYYNAELNIEPGEAPAEDATYYLARYVLENNRPWRELFAGPYRVNPGATPTADAVVLNDANGLGYFRSRTWMVRYAGNELQGYRLVAAYRMMNNVLGIKLVAAAATDGVDAVGRQAPACAGCHYNPTFGLDNAAKILSRRRVGSNPIIFDAPDAGPQPVLDTQIGNDQQLITTMVGSLEFRFNTCRHIFNFVYARGEYRCEGPVFDACMAAFPGNGPIQPAVSAVARHPTFCQ